MRKKQVSVRGNLMRDMIHDIMETSLKEPIQSGQFRRNPVERAWVCPLGYTYEIINMEHCVLEYLRPDHIMTGRVILQLHGGGYIGPIKNIYRKFAVRYSRFSYGSDVVSLDYRVAPEHPYPAALEDAVAAYLWLTDEKKYLPQQIVIAGDSAGGGLALALCMYLRDQKIPLPGGIVLMSPWTDMTCSGESYDSNYQRDPLFGNSRESMLYNSTYIGDADPTDPYLSPLFGDFTRLPPMLYQVGDYEMLLSDTVETAKSARAAGVKCRVSVYEGMFHVFQMSLDLFPESKEAWEEIKRFFEVIYEMERKPSGKVVRRVKRTKRKQIEDQLKSKYEDCVDSSRKIKRKILSAGGSRVSEEVK